MGSFTVEICCGSAEDVIAASEAGADRVELNTSMFLGGLTPTVGALRVAKKHAAIPVMCMIRPREGGFCYTEREFETALEDARCLLKNGADGIVFGFLHPDGTIDVERCRVMRDIANGRQTVFHRAIDVTPDWRAAMNSLLALGITRILTSGQAGSAHLGASTITAMSQYADGRIEILPGAGITPRNARELMAQTGCRQIHMSLHKLCYDRSTDANPGIHFGGALYPPEDRYKAVDRDALARFTKQANGGAE